MASLICLGSSKTNPRSQTCWARSDGSACANRFGVALRAQVAKIQQLLENAVQSPLKVQKSNLSECPICRIPTSRSGPLQFDDSITPPAVASQGRGCKRPALLESGRRKAANGFATCRHRAGSRPLSSTGGRRIGDGIPGVSKAEPRYQARGHTGGARLLEAPSTLWCGNGVPAHQLIRPKVAGDPPTSSLMRLPVHQSHENQSRSMVHINGASYQEARVNAR